MSAVAALPQIMIEPLVRAALLEDLGRAGDITTNAIVPADTQAVTVMAARQNGVVAGLDLAEVKLLVVRLDTQEVEQWISEPSTGN